MNPPKKRWWKRLMKKIWRQRVQMHRIEGEEGLMEVYVRYVTAIRAPGRFFSFPYWKHLLDSGVIAGLPICFHEMFFPLSAVRLCILHSWRSCWSLWKQTCSLSLSRWEDTQIFTLLYAYECSYGVMNTISISLVLALLSQIVLVCCPIVFLAWNGPEFSSGVDRWGNTEAAAELNKLRYVLK